jgi:hypothetical protein
MQYHHEKQVKKNENHQIVNGLKEGFSQRGYSTNVIDSEIFTTIYGSGDK